MTKMYKFSCVVIFIVLINNQNCVSVVVARSIEEELQDAFVQSEKYALPLLANCKGNFWMAPLVPLTAICFLQHLYSWTVDRRVDSMWLLQLLVILLYYSLKLKFFVIPWRFSQYCSIDSDQLNYAEIVALWWFCKDNSAYLVYNYEYEYVQSIHKFAFCFNQTAVLTSDEFVTELSFLWVIVFHVLWCILNVTRTKGRKKKKTQDQILVLVAMF